MSRGEGYVGFVVPGPSVVSRSDLIARPLMKELADRLRHMNAAAMR